MKSELEIVEAENSPLPSEFLVHLPEMFAREGQTIYRGRNEIKNFIVNGRTVCVKKYSFPPFFNRLFYSWGWRVPKAKRTYENARKIAQSGFQTPQQWGYVITHQHGLIGESYSVGEFVADAHTVGQDKSDEKLLRAFAQYTADLHDKGLMHCDYIVNNILYKCMGDTYTFSLIDVNRFLFLNAPVRGWRQRLNLMQLFHEPEELKHFVQLYQQITHVPDSFVEQVLCLRRWRTRYSTFKHGVLKKIPGTKWLTKHGN